MGLAILLLLAYILYQSRRARILGASSSSGSDSVAPASMFFGGQQYDNGATMTPLLHGAAACAPEKRAQLLVSSFRV